jgi:hypothetical protein
LASFLAAFSFCFYSSNFCWRIVSTCSAARATPPETVSLAAEARDARLAICGADYQNEEIPPPHPLAAAGWGSGIGVATFSSCTGGLTFLGVFAFFVTYSSFYSFFDWSSTALSKGTSSSYTSSKTGAFLTGSFGYKSTSSSSFFSLVIGGGFSVISSSNGFSETGAATSYSLSLIITSV